MTEPKPWLRELEVEVEADKVRQKIAESVDYLLREAEIPGFRKGHAPRTLVERRFGTEVESQTAQELIREAMEQAILEKQIRPLKPGELNDYELTEDKQLRFKVSVEVLPDFELKEYTGLPVTRPEPGGFDAEFERRLEGLRERLAAYSPLSRPSAAGDFVAADYSATDDQGRQIDKKTNVLFKVGDAENYPEMNEQLTGLKPGDEKDVTVKLPGDYRDPQYAGRAITYHLGVRGIKEKQLPDVDEDLAQNLGFESLDALRVWLTGEIRADQDRAIEGELLNQIYQHLLKSYDFEPPPSLVAEVYDQLLSANRLENTEAVRQKLEPVAQAKARFQIVVARIAQQENIEVTDEERDRVIDEYFANREPDPQMAEQLRNRESFRYRVLEDKVMRFLLTKASVTGGPVPSSVELQPGQEVK